MAKNDAILIDGIIQEKMVSELLDRGEAFEMFAFEQILKSYDLKREEMEAGWVDGKDDGGIDGFYTFVNGILVQKIEGFSWPRKNVSIDIWILSCKHHDSFKQEPINTIFPTIEELLDFTKQPDDFDGKYSQALIGARQIAVESFSRTAIGLPALNFHFAYASRGDFNDLAENIEARGNQLKRIVGDYFSAAEVTLEYFGAAELIELSRKNRVVLALPYAEQLSGNQGAFVLLVPIHAYVKFVSDEQGNLRRYLFDSNVRDFMGENRVNGDILDSLADPKAPDFWWLNNGITVLATSAVPLGKTPSGTSIQLQDVQIVNGLQTTQSIFNFFKAGGATADHRSVLVKVIVSENVEVRDKIIQATNNQTPVELAALNATDKIQRDIEQILERHEWYYERRKNYYKNIGKPSERFITPLFLAAGLVAVVRRAPQKAGVLKTRFMRNSSSYEAVFSDQISIEVWPKIAEILKAVETEMLVGVPPGRASGNRLISKWRGAVALCAIAKIHGTFNFSMAQLIATEVSNVVAQNARDILSSLRNPFGPTPQSDDFKDDLPIKHDVGVAAACRIFGNMSGIDGVDVIEKWQIPGNPPGSDVIDWKKKVDPSLITDSLLDQVDEALSNQPWQMNEHQQVADKLGIKASLVSAVIQRLIAAGRRFNQKDGVAYDKEKTIVAIDVKRANSKYRVGEKYER